MVRTACTEPQCLYSTAIPLLPLWAVFPVQSLSACTVELYLYSPYWPYGLFRASVPVQICTLPLPLPNSVSVKVSKQKFPNTEYFDLPHLRYTATNIAVHEQRTYIGVRLYL